MSKQSRRANGRRYSDAEKLVALEIIRIAGGSLTNEALQNIRTILKAPGLSFNSVAAWTKTRAASQESPADSVPSSAHNSTQVEVDFGAASVKSIVEHTFRQYARRANDKTTVDVTDGKDAAKIMVDMAKLMQLLDGMPTEIIVALPDLIETIRRKGFEPLAAMNVMKAQFAALPDAPMVTPSHGAN